MPFRKRRPNLGVNNRVYDEFHAVDATEEEMHSLTKTGVTPIYRRNYCELCRCPDLPSGVDWAVFDFAANAGTRRAAETLQRAVKVTEDDYIGPITLMTVKKHESTNIIKRMAIYREDFYKSLSNFDHLGKGWLRRTNETREQALVLL